MRAIMSFAGVCGLVFVVSIHAQEAVREPEHDKLKEQVGTWDAVAISNGKESKGVMTARMMQGGLWLIEEFQMEIDGAKFEGHGTTTYDPKKKKYVNIWVDSMIPEAMITEGTIDKNNRMILKGKMPMPDGPIDCTITNHRMDANKMQLTLEGVGPDGKSMEFVKITYTRRQK